VVGLMREIPNSQLKVIKDCGHMPEMERPEEFVHLVREFLLPLEIYLGRGGALGVSSVDFWPAFASALRTSFDFTEAYSRHSMEGSAQLVPVVAP
jgi:hypothetical protein